MMNHRDEAPLPNDTILGTDPRWLDTALAGHSRDNLPTIYLSGPMTGYENHNFPTFNEAARRLRLLGFPVLNPADFGGEDETNTYRVCLARDLLLLPHAKVVVMLPGWEESRGAGLEFDTALAMKIPVVRECDFGRKVVAKLFRQFEAEAIFILDQKRRELDVAYDATGSVLVGPRKELRRIADACQQLADYLGVGQAPDQEIDDESSDDE
jgi:hypothetical protein